LLLGLMPATAADLGSRKWTTVGNWEIWVDRTQGDSCYVMRSYERGAVFRIGFGRDASNGYVILANEKWKSLVVGSKYAIELKFDNNPAWKGNATARKAGNITYLHMDFGGQGLLKEFGHSDNASVTYKGQLAANVRLTGSDTAVEELMRCQATPSRALAPSDSQQRSAPDSDPFAR
jgi:hypothetical protein